MALKMDEHSFIIFDLDDTLYGEIDFVSSAFLEIAAQIEPSNTIVLHEKMMGLFEDKKNVFEYLLTSYPHQKNLTLPILLNTYRNHFPDIKLREDASQFINHLRRKNIPIGLITDGRSITQRNKLKALSIEHLFHDIIISEEFGSEKPCEKNFLYFETKYPEARFTFIGDNTKKDFVSPEKLHWQMVCIKDQGRNIHPQDFENCPKNLIIANTFDELI